MPSIFDVGVAPAEKKEAPQPKKTLNINDIGVSGSPTPGRQFGEFSVIPSPAKSEPTDKSMGELFGMALEKFDAKTHAPIRRALGALQEGKSPEEAYRAARLQFGSPGVLPDTPTMEKLTANAIEQHEILSKLSPADKEALIGFGGFVGGVATDPVAYVPFGAVKAGARAVGSGAKFAGKNLLGPVNERLFKTLQAADRFVARAEERIAGPIASAGQFFTGGNLEKPGTMEAFKNLSFTEAFAPGKIVNKKLTGKLAEAAKEVGTLRRSGKLNVPLSPESTQEVLKLKNAIMAAHKTEDKTPGSQILVDKLTRMFTPKTDPVLGSRVILTLQDVDELLSASKGILWTPQGSIKGSAQQKWEPLIMQAYGKLNSIFDAKDATGKVLYPDGALFKTLKTKEHNLFDFAKNRSALLEGQANVTSLQAAGVALGDPTGTLATAATSAAFVSRFASPYAWNKLLASIKFPRAAVKGAPDFVVGMLKKAHDSEKLTVLRDTFAVLAKQYPAETERVLRVLALEASKPDGGILGEVENEAPRGLLPPDAQRGIQIPAQHQRYLEQLKPQENIRFPGTKF